MDQVQVLPQAVHANHIEKQIKSTSMSTLQKPKLTKVCSKCKKEQPIENFSRSMEYLDGRISNCKGCYSERQRKRVAEKNKLADLYGI